MKEQNEESHFKPTYIFIAVTTLAVLAYVFAVTYIPIPKGNERFADTSLGFLLATFLGNGMSWLTGGSPSLFRKKQEPGTVSGEITGTISTEKEVEVK